MKYEKKKSRKNKIDMFVKIDSDELTVHSVYNRYTYWLKTIYM